MSKILSSVLDKISENNNEYRNELRTLNNLIDERTTALVGDVVTISGYVVDFSNAISFAKEKIVNPVSRIIESYVIRDLRSVETVNEQFVEKINDKIENSNITTSEDKDSFIASLNELLNNKYLEIVKIKRVDFLNNNKTNDEIENSVNDFIDYLNETYKLNYQMIESVIVSYKIDLYRLIENTLVAISNLYLNNFVNEVANALNTAIDYKEQVLINDEINVQEPVVPDISVPNIPVMPDIPEVPVIPDIPVIPEEQFDYNISSFENTDVSKDASLISKTEDKNISSDVKDINNYESKEFNNDFFSETEPMQIPSINPIEIENDELKKENKKSYDVDEILKIAKSPVVMMPTNEEKEENPQTILSINDAENLVNDYNERELVEELIERLTKRLKEIDEKEAKYEEDLKRLKEDESFVNDLIESSNKKIEELDKFESELDIKEQELNEKQKQLDKKINDVLPFANAVLENEQESL